jgi:hypothetical protein
VVTDEIGSDNGVSSLRGGRNGIGVCVGVEVGDDVQPVCDVSDDGRVDVLRRFVLGWRRRSFAGGEEVVE